MKLIDGGGTELELYSMRGESDEVNTADIASVVYCISRHYLISEEEAKTMLINSDEDNPVTYHDQIFWTELPIGG